MTQLLKEVCCFCWVLSGDPSDPFILGGYMYHKIGGNITAQGLG